MSTFRTSLKVITVISLLILQINADAIDKSVKQGLSDILDIKIPGVTVRQCSCDEQTMCTEEIKNQVFNCADTCWSKFEKVKTFQIRVQNKLQKTTFESITLPYIFQITKDPKELKECIDSKEVVFNNFVGCIQTNLHACVPGKDGPQIEKHDILKMFNVAEQKIVSQRESIRKLITTLKQNSTLKWYCMKKKLKIFS